MAIPAHKRVAFYGTLLQATNGGSDIFEFGYADTSTMSDQALSAALLPVMQTAWTSSSNNFAVCARLDGCRVETIDGTGKVTSSYATTGTKPTGGNTGAQIGILSAAITLETGTPNNHGRTVQGRFYPPAYPGIQGATFSSDTAELIAGIWVGIMNGLITAGSIPVVASRTNGGVLAPITAVSLDNVIDTQRRRKNHVTATRTAKHALSTHP